jgi:cyclic pyranopterin phosphate synthase
VVDITLKTNTLRIAIAQAVVKVGSEDTILAIEQGTVPKGNVFEMSKAAGLLGIKKTPQILPDCHPIPIEHAAIEYEIDQLTIIITVLVKTIYKTGVEVEAMHGASVVALNIYDMLKPIDKNVSISEIKLLEKKGGKSDFKDDFLQELTASILVVSSKIVSGQREDKVTPLVEKKLSGLGISVVNRSLVNDDKIEIENTINALKESANIVIVCGGTGVSKSDITPDVVKGMLTMEVPGIMEQSRSFGQNLMPYSMLSRGVAGLINNTLILTLPGSIGGVKESMQALFPHCFHIFKSIPK